MFRSQASHCIAGIRIRAAADAVEPGRGARTRYGLAGREASDHL